MRDETIKDVMRERYEMRWRSNRRMIGFGGLALFALIFLFGTFYTINAGERGILLTFGNPDPSPKAEGLHFKVPIVQRVVVMDIKSQKYEADAAAASKDLQNVHTKIAVNYHLVGEQVPEIFTSIGVTYSDRIIQPSVQEVVKAATAKFTAEELITHREEVKDIIKQTLIERLRGRGIIVEDISITNFEFSESFNAAIEAKVTAEQNAQAAKNKKEQVQYEADQKIISANAEAQSITIQSQALEKNKDILQLRAIEKWDGKMPLVTGGATPFIDVNRFTQQGGIA